MIARPTLTTLPWVTGVKEMEGPHAPGTPCHPLSLVLFLALPDVIGGTDTWSG